MVQQREDIGVDEGMPTRQVGEVDGRDEGSRSVDDIVDALPEQVNQPVQLVGVGCRGRTDAEGQECGQHTSGSDQTPATPPPTAVHRLSLSSEEPCAHCFFRPV